MSAPYAPQVGDEVFVGRGKLLWTVTALHGDGQASLRTGVGRLGRWGRTMDRPLSVLRPWHYVTRGVDTVIVSVT